MLRFPVLHFVCSFLVASLLVINQAPKASRWTLYPFIIDISDLLSKKGIYY